MGVSTVTCNIVNNPKRMQKRLLKDSSTTTQKLGLKVIGYVIKNAQKKAEEKFYKWPYIQANDVAEVLRKIFCYPLPPKTADERQKTAHTFDPDNELKSKVAANRKLSKDESDIRVALEGHQ